MGFRLYSQILSLKDGTLTVETVGTQLGSFRLMESSPAAEAVDGPYLDRSGRRAEPERFEDHVRTYFAKDESGLVGKRVIFAKELAASQEKEGVRPLLEESWKAFRFLEE